MSGGAEPQNAGSLAVFRSSEGHPFAVSRGQRGQWTQRSQRRVGTWEWWIERCGEPLGVFEAELPARPPRTGDPDLGWVKPPPATTQHYFLADERSACRSWTLFWQFPELCPEGEQEPTPECKGCRGFIDRNGFLVASGGSQ